MIGCSGRNKYEQCAKCRMFHHPEVRCPLDKDEKLRATKWKHSTNFAADSYLYNYWNAKKVILRDRTVILAEGSGDVWRLEEAGIYNSLGLLGAKLSTNQQIILEQSGAINLLIATDNDDAGDKAAASITKNCQHLFNVKRILFPTKDPGSLSVEQVKRIFVPILEKI
jgi:DNA primase